MAKKVAVEVFVGNLHFCDYEFEQDVITIGRRPENDIFLKHASVSGDHARIDLRAMTVTDLDSTNGTFCGGQKITTASVQYGRPISIEPYHITVSDRVGKRRIRHSDTLILSQGALSAQKMADDGLANVAEPATQHRFPPGIGRWLEEMPQWIPLAFLAIVIGVTLVLIGMSLSG